MRDQFVDGRIFVKTLPVLPRTEAVIEAPRLFGREVTIRWLANAQARTLAAFGFGRLPFDAQTAGLANWL